MELIIWQAKATQEEWEKLTDLDLDQIADDLEIYFEQLKEQHLDKGE